MKAWQKTADAVLQLRDVAEPNPADGEVVVDVRATGLCFSDLELLDGTLANLITNYPRTLGHEFAGVVSEIGPSVEGIAIGDRVGNASQGPSTPGVGRDGGHAERVAVSATSLVPVPDNVSFADAAAGTDAGKTSWVAVHARGQVRQGETVAIVGLGGLGMIAARLAVLAGATVYAAEPRTDIWDEARQLGVIDVVANVRDLAVHEPDVVIDLAGYGSTLVGALEAVRFGGRVVLVGSAEATATISLSTLIGKNISLLGTVTVDGKTAVEAVYQVLETGELKPQITTIGFDDIGDGLEQLRAGNVRGRLVAVLPGDD